MKSNSSFLLVCLLVVFQTITLRSDTVDNLPEVLWVTIDHPTYIHITEFHPDLLQITTQKTANTSDESTLYIAKIAKQDLTQLSLIMHDTFHRCGGFFTHVSEKDAQQSLLPVQKSSLAVSYDINNPDTVANLIARLSITEFETVVEQFGSYYSRYYLSNTGVESAEWLYSHWAGKIQSRDDISIAYFDHPDWPQKSVMVTINGSTIPNEFVVIGGHLDSINRINPAQNQAPGMDDNASGIAVISALLEMIVLSDYYPARSLVLVGYAAEEVGLLGSRDIARQFKQQNTQVVGVAQFDMTAYQGTPENDIVFISDFTDSEQTAFMASLLDEYHPDISYGFDVCGYACSDHASWHREGFRASFPFEARFNDSNPRIHTANDSFYDTGHMAKFARLAATYTAELAKGSTGIASTVDVISFQQNATQVNGGSTAVLTVGRNGLNSGDISVNYETIDGTARSGVHYTASSGQISWGANDQTNKTITVPTLNASGDVQFRIRLTSPSTGAMLNSAFEAQVFIKSVNQPTPPQAESSGGGNMDIIILLVLLSFLSLQWNSSIRKPQSSSK